jgi:hypothetical protein
MPRLSLFCVLLCLFIPAAPAQDIIAPAPRSTLVQFTADGAWCWFQDPRAVFMDGARTRTYACWVTASGELQIGAYDHRTGATECFPLKKGWEADDHNAASILVLPDRRIMVFYAQHNGDGLYCRTTSKPESIVAWDEEVVVVRSPRVSYSHPVYLTHEKRFYVFWRGESWKPTFATSPDGQRWTEARVLIQEPGREAGDIRPYLKVVSDGRASIHFAFTDGHPRDESANAIHYVRYEGGVFTQANGALAGSLDSLPVHPSRCDLVYDAKATHVRSWVWDIALDSTGKASIAYTRLPAETDHRYHCARWTGSRWLDWEVTPAGKWFPQTPRGTVEFESHYSGGIAFNQSDPSRVYVSREVNGQFEIEKWWTTDGGETWKGMPITAGSNSLNVRPVFPYGASGKEDHLLWMTGRYVHYTNFNTGIMLMK